MTIVNILYLASLVCAFGFVIVVGLICRQLVKRKRINEMKLKESAAAVGRTIVPAAFLGFGSTVVASEGSFDKLVLVSTISMVVLTLGAALLFYAATKTHRKR
jgi:protein-S-isoprenylcysteine O-methyltransferase Ste14